MIIRFLRIIKYIDIATDIYFSRRTVGAASIALVGFSVHYIFIFGRIGIVFRAFTVGSNTFMDSGYFSNDLRRTSALFSNSKYNR